MTRDELKALPKSEFMRGMSYLATCCECGKVTELTAQSKTAVECPCELPPFTHWYTICESCYSRHPDSAGEWPKWYSDGYYLVRAISEDNGEAMFPGDRTPFPCGGGLKHDALPHYTRITESEARAYAVEHKMPWPAEWDTPADDAGGTWPDDATEPKAEPVKPATDPDLTKALRVGAVTCTTAKQINGTIYIPLLGKDSTMQKKTITFSVPTMLYRIPWAMLRTAGRIVRYYADTPANLLWHTAAIIVASEASGWHWPLGLVRAATSYVASLFV